MLYMRNLSVKSRLALSSLSLLLLMGGVAMGFARADATRKGSPYPLSTCPVSGKPLTKDAAVLIMEDSVNPLNDGREIKFCCPNCIETFKADPAKFLPTIDAAIIAQQKARYPLTHCAVMTEDELPAAGQPDADKIKEVVVLNDLVRLCCAGCMKKLKKDPAKYLVEINAAVIASQKKTYALVTCPISGEELPEEPADIVIGERLVRLCCAGCGDKARQDPTAIFAKLDAAEAAKKPATAPAVPAK